MTYRMEDGTVGYSHSSGCLRSQDRVAFSVLTMPEDLAALEGEVSE